MKFEEVNLAYIYDGSFEGMLSCVFESFEKKEKPLEILDDGGGTLLPCKRIATDFEKAARVTKSINEKIGQTAFYYTRLCYLSCDKSKVLKLIDFLQVAYKYGANALQLAEDCVLRFVKMANLVSKEHGRFIEFIRFSEIDGVLISVIEPENNVLPLLNSHFADRFPNEKFMIYDAGRKLALVYQNRSTEIVRTNFEMPAFSKEEEKYRSLWQLFYDTIEIKERHSDKRQTQFLPKKYRKHMTEFGNK